MVGGGLAAWKAAFPFHGNLVPGSFHRPLTVDR